MRLHVYLFDFGSYLPMEALWSSWLQAGCVGFMVALFWKSETLGAILLLRVLEGVPARPARDPMRPARDPSVSKCRARYAADVQKLKPVGVSK